MITKRDLMVAKHLQENPKCKTSDIASEFFPSLRVAQYRLKKLSDCGALKREKCSVSKEFVYKASISRINEIEKKMYSIENEKSNNRFTSEENLQEYCAENIQSIENGLYLLGIEVPINNGFIDILALDNNGRICIIELKNIKNDKGIVHQCIHYSKSIKAESRIITIAPGYSKSILDSLKDIGVETKTYQIDDFGQVIFKDI